MILTLSLSLALEGSRVSVRIDLLLDRAKTNLFSSSFNGSVYDEKIACVRFVLVRTIGSNGGSAAVSMDMVVGSEDVDELERLNER